MPIETDKFILELIEWTYHVDRTQGGGRAPAPRVPGSPTSAQVTCKGCHHQWHWRQDSHDSQRGIGSGITLTCPKCAETESIQPKLFR